MFTTLLLAALVSTAAAAPAQAPVVGVTTADVYPPTGTTVDTHLFPDRTQVGYPHVTRHGAQPYAFVTAPAQQFPKAQQPFAPAVLPKQKGKVRLDVRASAYFVVLEGILANLLVGIPYPAILSPQGHLGRVRRDPDHSGPMHPQVSASPRASWCAVPYCGGARREIRHGSAQCLHGGPL